MRVIAVYGGAGARGRGCRRTVPSLSGTSLSGPFTDRLGLDGWEGQAAIVSVWCVAAGSSVIAGSHEGFGSSSPSAASRSRASVSVSIHPHDRDQLIDPAVARKIPRAKRHGVDSGPAERLRNRPYLVIAGGPGVVAADGPRGSLDEPVAYSGPGSGMVEPRAGRTAPHRPPSSPNARADKGTPERERRATG